MKRKSDYWKLKHCPVCRSESYVPIETKTTVGWHCKKCSYINWKFKYSGGRKAK
jgi:hypothetical protein